MAGIPNSICLENAKELSDMFPFGLLALFIAAAGAFLHVATAEYLHRRRGWEPGVRSIAWFWGVALLTGSFAFSHLVGELCLTEGKPAEDFSRFQHTIWLHVAGLTLVGSSAVYAFTLAGHWLVSHRTKPSTG
jgi:hypothetical protein